MTRKATAPARIPSVVVLIFALITLLAALAALAQQTGAAQSAGKAAAELSIPNFGHGSLMPNPPTSAGARRSTSKVSSPETPLLSLSHALDYSTGGADASLFNTQNIVALADVNGDGRLDVIVANWCTSLQLYACFDGSSTGSVSVLLGNGDGTFQPQTTYASGGFYAIAVLVADVNGDGRPDLVVANGCADGPLAPCPSEGSIGILLGNGDGTFQPVRTVATGGVPFSVAVADLNNDGIPDVVVANQGGGNNGDGSVGVLLGKGNGAFQPVQVYDSGGLDADFIVVADINHDAKPDLLVANLGNFSNGSSNVGVLLGNGDGTFKPVATYGQIDSGVYPSTGLVVADMNGDGNPDLIVNQGGAFAGGNFSVLLGNGDGTFQPAVTYSSGGLYNRLPVVADLRGDNKLDVIAPNLQCCSLPHAHGCVAVLLGNGDGTLQPPVIYAPHSEADMQSVSALAVSDLNGDGIPDISFVGSRTTGGYVGVLLGNGDGTFEPAQTYGAGGPYTQWVAAVDLNGGGKPDLLFQNPGGYGTVGVLLNETGVTNQTNASLSTTPDPSVVGQAVTFTATISSPQGTPPNGELVAFSTGLAVFGTAPLSGGIAALSSSSLPVGTYTVTATYVGDTIFVASTSPGATQVVNKLATSIAFTSSLNPAIYGQRVTFTAAVTNAGQATPTGKVTFNSAGETILGSATLNSRGVATLTKYDLNAGSYPLTVVYKGDANNLGSTSAILNQVVQQTTSAATITSSPNPSTTGQAVTFKARITSPNVTPKGSVTFTAGATGLGTVELSGGRATLTTSSLPAGSTQVTVTYAGDSNIAESSAALTQVVEQ